MMFTMFTKRFKRLIANQLTVVNIRFVDVHRGRSHGGGDSTIACGQQFVF
jgi:hypothetical protein